ncbi:MAG: hypothetical protein Q8R83_00345 [Legionellaceae bacterium]|nr:hypothetical protein [Legionellaceae bacterium]
MSELFDDTDEDKALIVDEDLVEAESVIVDVRQKPTSDARRRLEDLMEEKRLREELEDYLS